MKSRVVKYKKLMEHFLDRKISALEFQLCYMKEFKSEGELDEFTFRVLDKLFGDLDPYTEDINLAKSNQNFYVTEEQLRQRVRSALDRLSR